MVRAARRALTALAATAGALAAPASGDLVSGQVMQCGGSHQLAGSDHRYDDYRDDHVPQAFPGISIVTSHAARLAPRTCAGTNCGR